MKIILSAYENYESENNLTHGKGKVKDAILADKKNLDISFCQ